MFSLIKPVFILLLSFSGSLATKCVSLNNEPCMVRLTVIDLNSVELKWYPFTISLINVVEIVMSYRQKYVFRKKKRRKC